MACIAACGCFLLTGYVLVFQDDIDGMIEELANHYPGSLPVHEDRIFVGGMSNGATHLYMRWTPDNVTTVQAHYEQSPRPSISVYDVVTFDPQELFECRYEYEAGFCEEILSKVPRSGTLIVTRQRFFIP